MAVLKRKHKLPLDERKQKIVSAVVPKGWDDPELKILLRKEEVLKICGLTDASFLALRHGQGDSFPEPYLFITPRQPRWLGAEVNAWLVRRRDARHEDAQKAVPSTAFKKSSGVEKNDI